MENVTTLSVVHNSPTFPSTISDKQYYIQVTWLPSPRSEAQASGWYCMCSTFFISCQSILS